MTSNMYKADPVVTRSYRDSFPLRDLRMYQAMKEGDQLCLKSRMTVSRKSPFAFAWVHKICGKWCVYTSQDDPPPMPPKQVYDDFRDIPMRWALD